MFTFLQTAAANVFSNAFRSIYPWLENAAMAFRVPAPSAAQGTALEKDFRADAGTVMNGITLYIKNCTVF